MYHFNANIAFDKWPNLDLLCLDCAPDNHLNAEEEPELPDYPKDPTFLAKFGPRGVMDCKASDKDDTTVDPRFGKVGKQVCKDTGPLTKSRMVTIDDDIADRAVDFIQRQNKAGKPVFVWVNFTHMHFRTTPSQKASASRGTAQSAGTVDVQSPHGPIPAGGHHLKHLLRLVAGPCLSVGARAGVRRPVPDDLQGVSAATEGRQLHG
jgi:hypothetical protein